MRQELRGVVAAGPKPGPLATWPSSVIRLEPKADFPIGRYIGKCLRRPNSGAANFGNVFLQLFVKITVQSV